MVKFKTIKIFVLFTLCSFIYLVAVFSAEEITITTYYPSPHGIYEELGVSRLSVGDTSTPPDGLSAADLPSANGQLYVGRSVIFKPLATNPTTDAKEGELIYHSDTTGGVPTRQFRYYDNAPVDPQWVNILPITDSVMYVMKDRYPWSSLTQASEPVCPSNWQNYRYKINLDDKAAARPVNIAAHENWFLPCVPTDPTKSCAVMYLMQRLPSTAPTFMGAFPPACPAGWSGIDRQTEDSQSVNIVQEFLITAFVADYYNYVRICYRCKN